MAHIHERYDFVVVIFVVHAGRVLLSCHPRYDSMWLPIGGHIELHENPEEALEREIAEECGLEVELLADNPHLRSPGMKSMPTPRYLEVHDANAPHQHIALIYFGRAKHAKFVRSDEHTAMRWVSPDEFDDPELNLSHDTKFYCRQALKAAA